MLVDIIYFTHNRLEATKNTLPKLLESTKHPFSLTIVDNGSTDGTVHFLKYVVRTICGSMNIKLILNKENEGLSKPTNEFWKNSNAVLVGKIDNDILVENGWLEKLVRAHEKAETLAVVGGFHFPIELFSYENCKHNIFQINGVKILRQPYIGGNYLAKKSILRRNGYLDEHLGSGKLRIGGWTKYQLGLSRMDYVIGYHYPLIRFAHLRSGSNSYYKRVRGMSKRKYLRWEKEDAKKVLYDPWDWVKKTSKG
jgi:glycosyltransferase involved in cell wall biosynthesis